MYNLVVNNPHLVVTRINVYEDSSNPTTRITAKKKFNSWWSSEIGLVKTFSFIMRGCDEGDFLEITTLNYRSGVCTPCDNTVCGTCFTNDSNCIVPCHSSCKTCGIDGKCLTCHDGFFLKNSDKLCYPCDNSVCATC